MILSSILCALMASCAGSVQELPVVNSEQSVYKAPQPDMYANVHSHGDHWHSHYTREKHVHPNHQWDVVEVELDEVSE